MAPRRSARQKRLPVVQTLIETQSTSKEASDSSEAEMSPSLDHIVDSIAMSIDTPLVLLPPPQLGSTSKRCGRGPTQLHTLTKLARGQKFHLDWDEENNPIGIHAAEFASYCGYVVRCEENIPLTVQRWSEVPDENIKKSMDAVMEIFDYEQTHERLEYVYNDFSIKFRNYRSRLRKDHYLPYESDGERLAHPPKNVSKDAWIWLVNYWGTNRFNEMSEKNRISRSKHQLNHSTGRKSYARVIDEDTQATGKRPKRMRVYTITHTRKNGVVINKEAEEIITKVEELTQPKSDDPDAQPLSADEAFDSLFPLNRCGRPKGTTRRFTSQKSDTRNTQFLQAIGPLQTELQETRTTLEETRTELHETLATLQATQIKVEQQEERQLQQVKEISDLRGQVGQLYSMMLTLRSDQGLSYPPAPYFGGATSSQAHL